MIREAPPLYALRVFEAAARHLSFSKAAAEMEVTHGAISRQIKRLEGFLGCALFERRHNGIDLNLRGRKLASEIQQIFEELDAAVHAARLPEERQIVHVSTLPSIAARWLVPRLYKLQELEPDLELRITTSFELANLKSDGIDIAIRHGGGAFPDLDATILFGSDLFPVCAPTLIQAPGPLKTPADLAGVMLLHDVSFRNWQKWLKKAGADSVEPCKGLVMEDMNVLLQAAIEGRGVALAATPLVAGDIAAGRLVRPFDVSLRTDKAFYVVSARRSKQKPAIRRAIDWIVAEARQDLLVPCSATDR